MVSQAEFETYKELAQDNPDLPLTWDMVINIPDDMGEEERAQLIELLDKIQTTETGQDLLRGILLREDQTEPLMVRMVDQKSIDHSAYYDNVAHEVVLYSNFFELPLSHDDPDIMRDKDGKAIEQTQDQYLVHELGHAVDYLRQTHYDAKYETMAEYLIGTATEEMEAENWQKRYSEEMGIPVEADYITLDTFEISLRGHVTRGFGTEEMLAERLATAVIYQGIIDGKTPEQIMQELSDHIERVKEEHGIDLSQEVDEFLKSPAPEFDTDDNIVEAVRDDQAKPDPEKTNIAEPPVKQDYAAPTFGPQ